MHSFYPVVICGAGPTGLMLAAQLQRFGIDALIIDKKQAPTKESRAVVVQARSMEIYEQMDLSGSIVKSAEKTTGICFWRGGKKVSEASFFISVPIYPLSILLLSMSKVKMKPCCIHTCSSMEEKWRGIRNLYHLQNRKTLYTSAYDKMEKKALFKPAFW